MKPGAKVHVQYQLWKSKSYTYSSCGSASAWIIAKRPKMVKTKARMLKILIFQFVYQSYRCKKRVDWLWTGCWDWKNIDFLYKRINTKIHRNEDNSREFSWQKAPNFQHLYKIIKDTILCRKMFFFQRNKNVYKFVPIA